LWHLDISMQYRKEGDKCESGEACLFPVDEEFEIEILSVACVYIIL